MSHSRGRKYAGLSVLAACVGVGLLLWARFVLITNHPRTAIAEPGAAEVEGGASAQSEGNGSARVVSGGSGSGGEPGAVAHRDG